MNHKGDTGRVGPDRFSELCLDGLDAARTYSVATLAAMAMDRPAEKAAALLTLGFLGAAARTAAPNNGFPLTITTGADARRATCWTPTTFASR